MHLIVALALLGQPTPFEATVAEYAGCLRGAVQAGMMARIEPAAFRERFARLCLDQEARFREAATARAIELGRTPTEASQEVDGNIANGRQIFAADQESYIRTGRVPR